MSEAFPQPSNGANQAFARLEEFADPFEQPIPTEALPQTAPVSEPEPIVDQAAIDKEARMNEMATWAEVQGATAEYKARRQSDVESSTRQTIANAKERYGGYIPQDKQDRIRERHDRDMAKLQGIKGAKLVDAPKSVLSPKSDDEYDPYIGRVGIVNPDNTVDVNQNGNVSAFRSPREINNPNLRHGLNIENDGTSIR